jgi:predicted Ser/Thr protein kinase
MKSLTELNEKLRRENRPANLSFEQFLGCVADNPARSLRSIFQLFHDMIHYYVPAGVDEYLNDPESINYIHYDCSDLFVKDSENPFFADRLLANRLVSVADSFKSGALRNKMMVFIGPPGSGKSTFLNNLMNRMEQYADTEAGVMYETVWQIDVEKFGLTYAPSAADREAIGFDFLGKKNKIPGGHSLADPDSNRKLIVPCPSHDHPIIQIPREFRRDLLDQIIEDKAFKRILFTHKEYEWVFRDSPCAICSSMYRALCDKLSPEEVLSMLYVRNSEFSRKLGDGLSVFNPGDRVMTTPLEDPELQRWIGALFKSSNEVPYIYSRMAKTNNGILAIMDAKSNNIDRLRNVHGIISDGIHKVHIYEERINSLFMALVNPGDLDIINEEKSFRDRIIEIPIPYVRDYSTEVEIYRNVHGGGIDSVFMPKVLTSFAKVIIASRLEKSEAVKNWIERPEIYSKMIDADMKLLKMEIFSGNIPQWLADSDVKRLDRKCRRRIIVEGDVEGRIGFSGRQSLEMFNSFLNMYRGRKQLITIHNVVEFFRENTTFMEKLSAEFLDSLINLYDYMSLQEIKESMFYYNQEQIINSIFDYLFAINHDKDTEVECPFTHNKFVISEAYLEHVEKLFLGQNSTLTEREKFRDDALRKYVARTIHDVGDGSKHIIETQQFQELLRMYNQNLKQNVLDPFVSNDNFRRAIKDFDTTGFKNYDYRIRKEVEFLMRNLKFKFGYNDEGAKAICIYAIDNKLADRYN